MRGTGLLTRPALFLVGGLAILLACRIAYTTIHARDPSAPAPRHIFPTLPLTAVCEIAPGSDVLSLKSLRVSSQVYRVLVGLTRKGGNR